VSSSGHLVLVPRLLDWPYARLDARTRKSFEVALHVGTALALGLALRDEVLREARRLDARRVLHAALAFAPPAVAGLRYGSVVEERLGTVRGVALAQIFAGLALGGADRRPERRGRARAGAFDHLALGVAQAAALAPGVSRGGATVTAARALGLTRSAAGRLSREMAGPIVVGAAALEGKRQASIGLEPGLRAPFAVGVATAFASSWAASRLVAAVEGMGSYRPFAVYRVALGAAALMWARSRPLSP